MITRRLIANCSAPRQLTEMGKYSLERTCSEDFKKYKTNSVGCLWAEQFAIKVDQFYRDFLIFSKIRDKIDRLWSQIAQLTGNPQNWFCTFQRVFTHFGELSGSWAIHDQRRSISSRFFLNNKNLWFFKILIKFIDFDRELLSSQTTHRNGFELFEITRTILFHRV